MLTIFLPAKDIVAGAQNSNLYHARIGRLICYKYIFFIILIAIGFDFDGIYVLIFQYIYESTLKSPMTSFPNGFIGNPSTD